MFQALNKRLKRLEHALDGSFGNDISTPWKRFGSKVHFQLLDHAFLRVWWTNLDEIAPGVWRSNQPSPARIARYARMGIKSIITLRGFHDKSFSLFEEEACKAHGIAFHRAYLRSRGMVEAHHMIALLDLFKTVEKPFLMHCKSGADRAGLASALWMLAEGSGDIEEAKAQLSFRYLHLKSDKTGIIDMFLQAYEEAQQATGIGQAARGGRRGARRGGRRWIAIPVPCCAGSGAATCAGTA